jgi:hypothetical protein
MRVGRSQQSFTTGAVRDTADDKPRLELISPFFEERLGNWLARGARKYESRNWEKGIPIGRCLASLKRHVKDYQKGMEDEDHLAAIACNIMFIIHYEEMMMLGKLPKELLDIPRYLNKNYKANGGKKCLNTRTHSRRS